MDNNKSIYSADEFPGKQLRGENLAKYFIVKVLDGYEVIYALQEIYPGFTSNTVLLTTYVDGNPLRKGEGPFRLVNPVDKKRARWIREIYINQNSFLKRLAPSSMRLILSVA